MDNSNLGLAQAESSHFRGTLLFGESIPGLSCVFLLGRFCFCLQLMINQHLIGPLMAAGCCVGNIFHKWLAPMMGITSVVWVIMRGDPSVKPEYAWLMFSYWLALYVAYMIVQNHRVGKGRPYVFATITAGSICLCISALFQKPGVHGGLAAASPPCASFAAYAVAYFWPNRNPSRQALPVYEETRRQPV
ncbi:hypothetical protein BS50DRAFT_570244 [Corynespora cassiicola Philippines]|uniref:Uncharacterized protein n=1 Tax=Corynespora cassiicola Philippines TaxID=1448308 RepID=A0A2T2NZ84_CORCC|nr:hypothetical protein BS50DRAFT_570244 [Corynespora cassiicola Philippines]